MPAWILTGIAPGMSWATKVVKFNERGALKAVGCLLASGDPGVAEYRAYVVGHDGHFLRFEALICADDAEAIEKAKRLVDVHDVELWSGERLSPD